MSEPSWELHEPDYGVQYKDQWWRVSNSRDGNVAYFKNGADAYRYWALKSGNTRTYTA